VVLRLIVVASVILICILLNRFSNKAGIPMLLAFIILGMIFGIDGIFKIPFENYRFAEEICSIALIFIMFYGGFGTNWNEAKPVSVKAALLSTAGVVFTAALVGIFCYVVLHLSLLESFLLGSVISSTDAASVFSILRSKKMGLKYRTDSMLEIESGSNDPCSYMLTMIILSIMEGKIGAGSIVYMIFAQFAFGILIGVAIALGARWILEHFQFDTAGFDMAFVIGIALLSYSLAALLGGNGYLSVYICGILLGNSKLQNKKSLVHFFDGVTGLMQMLIFFLLGLLATPSKIPSIFVPAFSVAIFLTFVARPISVFAILSPFHCDIHQQILVSFAGLRGAASIVFAIMATVNPAALNQDVFHIVFCIVLLSILFQGSLLPFCAKFLKMDDENVNIMRTFNDYSEDSELQFIKIKVTEGNAWIGNAIKNIVLPPDTLIVMILREGKYIIPNGKTIFQVDDIVVLSAYTFQDDSKILLKEQKITPDSKWIGKKISEFSPHAEELVIMIIRRDKNVIPKGNTVIEENDVLVVNSSLPN